MPSQHCEMCKNVVQVVPDGRGFPPDIAKRKLQRMCKEQGCTCSPIYTADFKVRPRVDTPNKMV